MSDGQDNVETVNPLAGGKETLADLAQQADERRASQEKDVTLTPNENKTRRRPFLNIMSSSLSFVFNGITASALLLASQCYNVGISVTITKAEAPTHQSQDSSIVRPQPRPKDLGRR